MKFRPIYLVFALLGGGVAQATTIVSSFGSISGLDNDNQAGPIRGVTYRILVNGTYTNPSVTQGNSSSANSYTATHALSATDPSAPEVEFQSLSWQASSSTAFAAGTYYVSIFSGLTVNASGTVTSLGTFVASSSNSLSAPALNSVMTWNFDDPVLTVGSDYQFVFTSTATPTLTSHVLTGQFELKTGTNLLAETSLVGGNAAGVTNRNSWEPVFSMTYNSIPEPTSVLLASVGTLFLVRRRRL